VRAEPRAEPRSALAGPLRATPAGPLRVAPGSGSRDPLGGVERILVDGSNLLHALRRGAGPAPAATLIGRLRAIIPPTVRIELVFDGPPEHGLRGTRIAAGLTVRHSGRYTADSLIDRLVADAIGTGGDPDQAYAVGAAILVVTDDAELARMIRRRGARTIGADWLVRHLDRPALSSPSVGASRPPRPTDSRAAEADGGDDRPGWRPGRGATKKTGNPKRGHPSGKTNRSGS
jgi:rRNA-processing protein FCF1